MNERWGDSFADCLRKAVPCARSAVEKPMKGVRERGEQVKEADVIRRTEEVRSNTTRELSSLHLSNLKSMAEILLSDLL